MLPLIETWKSLFEWSSVGLLALTFVAGAGTLITTQIINRRQAAVILDLEKSAADAKAVQQKVEIELAKAKTKQAEAEKALLELQNLILPFALGATIRRWLAPSAPRSSSK